MRHQNVTKKLGREKGPRNSLFRATATNLLNYESINTTLAKAKATRSYIEKMITKAKRGTLHDVRIVGKEIHDKEILGKLFNDVAKRFEKRNGGYTRIIKTGPRKNDGAEMARFELVEKKEKVSPKAIKDAVVAKKAVKKETKSTKKAVKAAKVEKTEKK